MDVETEETDYKQNMEIEEIEMKMLEKDTQREPKPKPGKGIATKGYKEDYELYEGSKIHEKVLYFCVTKLRVFLTKQLQTTATS